jgi:hypothetical protein
MELIVKATPPHQRRNLLRRDGARPHDHRGQHPARRVARSWEADAWVFLEGRLSPALSPAHHQGTGRLSSEGLDPEGVDSRSGLWQP